MRENLQAAIKTVARRLGIEISHYRPLGGRRAALLARHDIATVVDVGANTGEYGCELRQFGYRGLMRSFEPLSEAFDLLKQASEADPLWDCYRLALGEENGTADLAVASNLASSSLLPMLTAHRRGAPRVDIIGHERVEVQRFDSLAIPLTAPVMMKLDVQGYEDRVLRGAEESLTMVEIIECEVSLDRLYGSQPDLLQMLELLHHYGFRIESLEPGMHDVASGKIMQYDAIAIRTATRAAF